MTNDHQDGHFEIIMCVYDRSSTINPEREHNLVLALWHMALT